MVPTQREGICDPNLGNLCYKDSIAEVKNVIQNNLYKWVILMFRICTNIVNAYLDDIWFMVQDFVIVKSRYDSISLWLWLLYNDLTIVFSYGFFLGRHLYFGTDIILVKGLSKHILSTYFPSVKMHPNYMFLHVFSLFFHHVLSQICKNDKNTPFFLIFRYFAPLIDVCMYVHRLVLKNNHIMLICFTRMISNF